MNTLLFRLLVAAVVGQEAEEDNVLTAIPGVPGMI